MSRHLLALGEQLFDALRQALELVQRDVDVSEVDLRIVGQVVLEVVVLIPPKVIHILLELPVFLVGIQDGGGYEVLDARRVARLAKRRYELREPQS